MTPEGKAKADVVKSLKQLLSTGDIYWFSRMQSGIFTMGDCHIHACEPGTFDLIATFQDKKKNLVLAFIEVKRTDIKPFLSESQKAFKMKYDGKHANILFWLVQSGKEVKRLVLDNCYNRVDAIDFSN
jgi:hypothetical protein